MNKKLYISFPSKTFLIGEYAILHSAPAVLVNTTPLFQFVITSKTEQSQRWIQDCSRAFQTSALNDSSNKINPSTVKSNISFYKNIHSDSPAGQWLKQHPHIQQHWHIESIDPHKGQGGFGFSSAQFNLIYFLTQINLQKQPDTQKTEQVHTLWQSYKTLNFDGHVPSGADVVSQWIGQVCLFASTPFKAQPISWPFNDLDFLIIRTGLQLQTWKHLNNISLKELTELTELSQQAMNCVNNQDAKGFVSSIEKYGLCLEKQNLVHKNTMALLNKIKKLKPILTAKGCGAMGAEVIILFFHPQHKEQVKSSLKNLFKDNLIIADSSKVTAGLQIQCI